MIIGNSLHIYHYSVILILYTDIHIHTHFCIYGSIMKNDIIVIFYCSWGGCIVAIINKNGVQQFVEALRAYLCQNSTKNQAELEDMVFPTSPNQGAIIYTMPIVGEGEIRQGS